MTYSNLGPWEDDGLPTDEERAECWRVEHEPPLHRYPCCGAYREDGCQCEPAPPRRQSLAEHLDEVYCYPDWGTREDDVESGHPLSHQRGDDGEHD